jgi:hypothetical protein
LTAGRIELGDPPGMVAGQSTSQAGHEMNSLLSYPDLYSSCSGPALCIPVLNFPSLDVNATTS